MIGLGLRQLQDAINRKADSIQKEFIALSERIDELGRMLLEAEDEDRQRIREEQKALRGEQQELAEEINIWRDRARSVTTQPGQQSLRNLLNDLMELEEDQSLLVQSGKPVGVVRSHPEAPRVLIANANLVPHWATWDHFNDLKERGLIMFGQMTAGSWIYIGSQGILQGTYETFVSCGDKYFNGNLLFSHLNNPALNNRGNNNITGEY